MEYKNILVATDGSTHAVFRSARRIAIAKQCGSRIIALSATRDETEREEAVNLSNKAVEMAKKEGGANPLDDIGGGTRDRTSPFSRQAPVFSTSIATQKHNPSVSRTCHRRPRSRYSQPRSPIQNQESFTP